MYYPTVAGVDPERTTLVNALATAGVTNPKTGEPFTEPWVLGLGGGLGSTYILWEFQRHAQVTIVLAFGHRANYPKEHVTNVASRTGASLEILETGSKKKAWAQLLETVDSGSAAICTVDPSYLPHLQMPSGTDGCFGWVVNAIAADPSHESVTIHDISSHSRTVAGEAFEQARARVGSYKHRLIRVARGGEVPDLRESIRGSIAQCCDYLGSSSDSFGLRSIRKWARLMTDTRNKKGWPTVFPDGKGLFGALSSIYRGVQHDASGGSALRDLYAVYLREAGEILGSSAFEAAATAYDRCAGAWRSLADIVLPADLFREARHDLDRRYEIMTHGDDSTDQEAAELTSRIDERMRLLDTDAPVSGEAQAELFSTIQASLTEVYTAEVEALELLEACR